MENTATPAVESAGNELRIDRDSSSRNEATTMYAR